MVAFNFFGFYSPAELAVHCWPYMCTQYAFFQATLIHMEGCCRNRQKTLKTEIWQNTFSFLCWTLYTFLLKLRTDFLTHPLSSAVFFPACSVSGQPTASPVAALFFTASAAPRGSGGNQAKWQVPGKGNYVRAGRQKCSVGGEHLCLKRLKVNGF